MSANDDIDCVHGIMDVLIDLQLVEIATAVEEFHLYRIKRIMKEHNSCWRGWV